MMGYSVATGYLLMLSLLLRVLPGGFHMSAPVCSTFTWINRASSGRTSWSPLGDINKARIALANVMVTRTILALLLSSARGQWWVLEQPALSIMQYHPAFRLLRRFPENPSLEETPPHPGLPRNSPRLAGFRERLLKYRVRTTE
jgi:hypothetical protein